MSSDFVRYSPEIETFDPKLGEYMARIIDFWETKVRESPTTEGSGPAAAGPSAAPTRRPSASSGQKWKSSTTHQRPTRKASMPSPVSTTR
jgi:hypothetical protein